MALRYLAGKLRVPVGAALRRAEGSRGISSRSPQVESGQEVASELWSKEDLQEMAHRHEDMIRRINEARLSRERYEKLDALCVSVGALLGFFVGVLMIRYENRTGRKISKMVCGVRTE